MELNNKPNYDMKHKITQAQHTYFTEFLNRFNGTWEDADEAEFQAVDGGMPERFVRLVCGISVSSHCKIFDDRHYDQEDLKREHALEFLNGMCEVVA